MSIVLTATVTSQCHCAFSIASLAAMYVPEERQSRIFAMLVWEDGKRFMMMELKMIVDGKWQHCGATISSISSSGTTAPASGITGALDEYCPADFRAKAKSDPSNKDCL